MRLLEKTTLSRAVGGRPPMSHPTHHYLFDQSENCKTCSLSFFMLFLLHTGLSACKDFSLLHLASQRSTSTAYHLILNRSVSPAHPARGDPVPAGRSACMAVHSPRMSSWESCVAGSSATAQATGAGPGGSVGAGGMGDAAGSAREARCDM